MAAGFLSKGLKLSYKTSSTGTYTDLTDMQEIPALGGEKDSVETTTLDDAAHTFINGLISYGDSLPFKFLYKTAQFQTLDGMDGQDVYWQVSIPDGEDGAIDTVCTFQGEPHVTFDAVGTNAPLTYTLNIKPTTAMEWA